MQKRDEPPLSSKMVLPSELHPVAAKTRKELSKSLLQRPYARVWDTTSADPSPYCDAAVLLTPPYNTGSYLNTRSRAENKVQVMVYCCFTCVEFTCLTGVMAILSGPIPSMSNAELDSEPQNPLLPRLTGSFRGIRLGGLRLHLRVYMARAWGKVAR